MHASVLHFCSYRPPMSLLYHLSSKNQAYFTPTPRARPFFAIHLVRTPATFPVHLGFARIFKKLPPSPVPHSLLRRLEIWKRGGIRHEYRQARTANPRPTMMAAQRAGLGRIVGGTAGLAPGRTPWRTYAPCCIARGCGGGGHAAAGKTGRASRCGGGRPPCWWRAPGVSPRGARWPCLTAVREGVYPGTTAGGSFPRPTSANGGCNRARPASIRMRP